MPKQSGINSILVIGAGPIIIGQACEFDYSGVQACKALREEGIKTILVNSNPATIMTDPDMADKIYIEPIHWRNIEKIIAIEKPDAILPTMGGQTALNTTLDLNRHKILEKYNVKKMEIKKGDDFDSEYHEAITSTPSEKKYKGKIIDVVENGYHIGDNILRFAKVVTGS